MFAESIAAPIYSAQPEAKSEFVVDQVFEKRGQTQQVPVLRPHVHPHNLISKHNNFRIAKNSRQWTLLGHVTS
jgi:hypothetical protein